LLDSSLDRLLLQLWPGALFLYFMVTRTLEEGSAEGVVPSQPVIPRAESEASR
jgi:hypothetical protein